MAFDLRALGEKLQRYRNQFEASLQEVSQDTGIPESDLAAFEEGKREPSGDEILILADYYKCDYSFFTSNERLAAFEQTEVLFRKHGDEISRTDRWAIQEFLYLCACEEFLMRQLPTVTTRSEFKFQKRGTYFKGHGKEAAQALRQHLGYSAKDIPNDIYRDFRRIGLHVFRRKLENSNISGLYLRHPYAGKCLLINYSEDNHRQRFSASHEAGHAILDDEQDFVISFTSWQKGDLSEVRANVFASAYLLPESSLRNIPRVSYSTPERAAECADKLRVSRETFAIAMKEAGLISDRDLNDWKRARYAAEKEDPELPRTLPPKLRQRRAHFLERGLSTFYVELVFRGYEETIISAGRMAEMLLLHESKLAGFAEIYGRSLDHGD
jgi:Zn-dependent peptidase ImmA (M78 family)